ncbi:stage II sporulation protein D [Paenibacillus abyssi]|uniref:Stage II sporulation protein D n=1 Tax=Paenibacillus abyssi TaxID=1340531 RepID=A0A917CKH4_9BACL|nr:stage II sporulation protein D [Paenibacillus abyssi]GGF91722.1 stage II sporulation protein D [Paenibacillus abyssi]
MKILGSKFWWMAFGLGLFAIAVFFPQPRQQPPVPVVGQAIVHFEPEATNTDGPQERNTAEPVEKPADPPRNVLAGLRVNVYLTEEKRVERIPLELYVRGVIAGEMPVDFELEALKAQAIAARTYIIRHLSNPEARETLAQGDVTDTVQHQVYIPLKQLLSRWPKDESEANLSKLNQAVDETSGQIITYNGEPIEASFFSTSNGYTENSEDYWSLPLPYLRSVASPWDEAISPRYKETVSIRLRDFYKKLGVKRGSEKSIRVLQATAGKRIQEIAIGSSTFSGREIRERLGLASSQFTWQVKGRNIEFTTYGYGHGVGMSQWGANGMAKTGKNAEQILKHYYTGTKVEQASKLPDSI